MTNLHLNTMATNEYKMMLKILNHVGSDAVIHNKLIDLSLDAENKMLKDLAQSMAKFIAPRLSKKSVPASLLQISSRIKASQQIDPSERAMGFARLIDAAKHTANTALASDEPGWMQIARSHGWTPPPIGQQKT